MSSAGRSEGVPPPMYTLSSAGRDDPNRSSSASARRSISVRTASRKAAIRAVGPRAAAPAYTTKSQYGQREMQNGTWM